MDYGAPSALAYTTATISHDNYDCALAWASGNRHSNVVTFLREKLEPKLLNI